ncbi:hydroxyacylglutathione hydrolase [Psychrosphaera sp. B3R10]|uniref:hydroxyacylglutathione hydrolase n=1 Tax=unclassified Psychrosphaera TaxID=2641570 RepID=UPI001C09B151|nr:MULTISPECIES: hydroxyacylglutathione hydrolase [unclassified Psychrosphaera]MBU2882164.1 hydroxyacylglutathione hydrolase [Psychrosphaera sp. I2R16]MBU2988845.1 hydroxyacylglutathione hydrolase [Psychrosphaera sp. B3R10]MDO6717865.1 hydroxyacylglutathione hydrolase [Psychrosphaera sp. 1_MG-2023]
MYQVVKIPAFSDNYIWAIHNNEGKCAIVDPGDGDVVMSFLQIQQFELTEILITHHHSDHIGGVKLLQSHFPNCKIYGPDTSRFNSFAQGVKQGDVINLEASDTCIEVIEVPGHTIDHIAYFDSANVFVGDTLFSAGCGRLFEGSAEQMLVSLKKISRLAPSTNIYCAHEYTASNIQFAKTVDPSNQDLIAYESIVKDLRKNDFATIPTTVEVQNKINPFLRCDSLPVKHAVEKQFSTKDLDEKNCFANLRRWKDSF